MRILYGSPGDSSRTHWFQSLRDDPRVGSETLWLTPTQRKREWVIERFRQQHRKWPPRIHSFDEMTRMVYAELGGSRRLLDPMATQFIMLSILKAPAVETVMQHWLSSLPGPGFLQEMTREIDRLQRNGTGVDQLDAVPDASHGLGELFLVLYRTYDSYLRNRNLVDIGGLQIELQDLLQEAPRPPESVFPWRTCVLDGFFELTPLQLQIIKELDQRLDVTLIWPCLPVPNGMFQWHISGLKTMFPDATWELLETSAGMSPGKNGVTYFDKCAMSLADIPVDGVVSDVKPVPLPEPSVDKPVPLFQSPIAKPVPAQFIEEDTIRDEVIAIAKNIKSLLVKPVPLSEPSVAKPVPHEISPKDIAVTFPDLKAYAPLVRRIFRRYDIPVNVSQSLPLTGSPVFISLERLLRLQNFWLRDDVLAILSDPLLTGWSPEKTHRRVSKVLIWTSQYRIVRSYEQWQNGLKLLMKQLPPDHEDVSDATAVKELLQKIGAQFEAESIQKPRSLAGWLLHLREILTRLELHRNIEQLQRTVAEYSTGILDHFEHTRRAYNCLISFFDNLEPFLLELKPSQFGMMTMTDFQLLLPRLFSGVNYQLTTRSGDRVQVLGILGIRSLTFKHVFFGGLTETALPQLNTISSFWSPELTDVLLERPIHNNRVSAFADIMRVIAVATEFITFSYPSRKEDETILPSLFWEYLKALFLGDTEKKRDRLGNLFLSERDRLCWLARLPSDMLQLCIQSQSETDSDSFLCENGILRYQSATQLRSMGKDEYSADFSKIMNANRAVAKKLNGRVGIRHHFSVSQLETYIDCPRKYFFDRVVGLGEPELPDEELSPLEKGSLIHTVLEIFYRRRLQQGKGRIHENELQTAISDLQTIANEQFAASGSKNEAASRQLQDLTGRPMFNDNGVIDRFAAFETSISAKLQPEQLEWVFGQTGTAPPLILQDNDKQKILIQGKIDRIDCCGDECAIWDYKSGNLPSKKDIDNLTKIQVGLYLLAAEQSLGKKVTVAGYYQVKGRTEIQQMPVLRLADSEIDQMLPDPASSRSIDHRWDQSELDEYIDQLLHLVADVVSRMRGGFFPIAFDSKRCEACPFLSICRPEEEMSS